MAEVKKEILKVDRGSEGTENVSMNFPSNARSVKKEEKEEKKITRVTSGKVLQRKKPFMKRLTETFVGEDVDNVWSYLVHDVLIPAAKNTINDMVQGGIEMILFGERNRRGIQRDKGKSFVSYNSFSSQRDYRRDDRREMSYRGRATHNFDEIILASRGEAEEVLNTLIDAIEAYGQVSVADLYDAVGITGEFTDNKYGWRNLSSASVSRAREGYLLNLPKAILLD